MFQPFDNVNQFYAGLILWCDPHCYEMDVSTLAPNELYDPKKARELRPCLVVAVDHTTRSLQVARICATTPRDTRRWVRIDTPPAITWRLSDAWIWVGTPPTVAMVLNNAKVMHPHKHTHYTSSPVAAANLQNYWVHRQNYLSWHADIATPPSTAPQAGYSQANTIYSTARGHAPSASGHGYSNHRAHSGSSSSATYHPTPGYAQPQMQMQPAPGFNTLSPHPVVVPPGFTETHPGSPGWWRNPETGWFWNASRGLLPPRDK
ncbi:hypothetical protein B0H14DRAFT_660064 [Mycena olivaceomarginata]|nr:hypothetical protein B0H14DRAFT_660064 [Mycena olivaceomarginata]